MITNTTGPRRPFHEGFFFRASMLTPDLTVVYKGGKVNRYFVKAKNLLKKNITTEYTELTRRTYGLKA